ncbi:MAG: YraN family protein [Candidatus Obscuribacterales bacterium]|nr:YraN family protein [Candidatus Obscuribacterales bacterium]
MKETLIAKKRRLSPASTGEDLAALYLEEKGARLLERNFRVGKRCEIDIIAVLEEQTGQAGSACAIANMKEATKTRFLTFIEVKTRRYQTDPGAIEHTGLQAISRDKRQKIRLGALSYLEKLRKEPLPANLSHINSENDLCGGGLFLPIRFDLILVDLRLSREAMQEFLKENDTMALRKAARIKHFEAIF